jgi:hypothetical protein
MAELVHALMPLGWDPHKYRNYIPNPDKPEYLKYDPDGKEYDKLLKEETQKRKEIMQEIIKKRENPEYGQSVVKTIYSKRSCSSCY